MTSRRTSQKTRRYRRVVNRTQTRRRKNIANNTTKKTNNTKSRQHGG